MKNKTKCSVCQTEVLGLYCYNCGQKITRKRLTFKTLIAEFSESVFSLEKTLFQTLYSLLVKPKQVIVNYWEGNRNYYYSPGRMTMLAIFIIGINLFFVDKEILGVSINMTGISKEASFFISPQVFFILLMLPLISITTYLTYFKQKHHLLEHISAVTYIFAYWAIVITLIWDLLEIIINDDVMGAFVLFCACVFIWTASVFTNSRKWYRVILNTLAEIFVFWLLILSILGILYLFDPNTLDLN